jgi:putative transposase
LSRTLPRTVRRNSEMASDHRAYQLYAHITWHTYRRIGCLDSAAVNDVSSAIHHASSRCCVNLLRSAVLADHVHLLISYRPSTRLSDFVRICKSVSAYRANKRVPGAIRWAKGYYVSSVGRRQVSVVDRYIARQFERHPDRIPARHSWRPEPPQARSPSLRLGSDLQLKSKRAEPDPTRECGAHGKGDLIG